ncbi:methyltransferase [Candidatus Bathyarchaeota archaeon]|nr:methyltransferase [Candidatus Bathyarchaeota archaeon]
MIRNTDVADHYFTEHPKSKPRYGLVQTSLRGRRFEFLTASGVFSMRRVDLGTRLLIESMVLPAEGSVLDVGCGYGAVGIAAAVFNLSLQVMLVDVNERAVWLARQNATMNGAHNVEARRGRLYEPVNDIVFDCILSNPPLSAGMETVKAIISHAPEMMTSKALFQMVVKSKIAGERFCSLFEEAFGNVKVSARESGYRVLVSKK